jgi:serine/threonine-protein kinase
MHVDHRADVFGLGILLYEMTVGRHPFDASGPSVIERILNAGYKRPRQVVPNFPSSLDSLICQCMAPHPEGRPASMNAVIGELAAYMSRRGIVPTMPSVASYVTSLVPDTEGERPLKPLLGRPRMAEPSGTQELYRGSPGGVLEAAARKAPVFDPDEATEPVNMRVAEMAAAVRAGPEPQVVVPEEEATTGYHRRIPTEDLEPPSMPAIKPGRRRRSRAFMLVGSALLVTAVGVAAFVTARAFSKSRMPDEHLPGPTAEPPDTGEPETAFVRVESTPAGARIEVNGEAVSRVTPSHVLVDGSQANIRLTLEGFAPFEGTVSADARVAHFTLVPVLSDGAMPHDGAADAATDAAIDSGVLDDSGAEPAKTKRRRRRWRRPRRRWRRMR